MKLLSIALAFVGAGALACPADDVKDVQANVQSKPVAEAKVPATEAGRVEEDTDHQGRRQGGCRDGAQVVAVTAEAALSVVVTARRVEAAGPRPCR